MIYQQLMCKLLSKIQICIYLFVIYKSTWLRNCTMHSLIGYFQGKKGTGLVFDHLMYLLAVALYAKSKYKRGCLFTVSAVSHFH